MPPEESEEDSPLTDLTSTDENSPLTDLTFTDENPFGPAALLWRALLP
jgi:hypothetical protein